MMSQESFNRVSHEGKDGKAPIIGIRRFRIGTDGNGITTLVGFHGCPLRCRFCLNPSSINDESKVKSMSPEEVMKVLRKDELYFVATNGGVTFGGGEPFIHSSFIKNVLDMGAKEWRVTVETSLNVPLEKIKLLTPYVDEYIVDIKDMDPNIYSMYTGKDNRLVLSNLSWLMEQGFTKRILCRIPLIPGFNSEEMQERSKDRLVSMGIERFDLFTYTTEK